MYDYILVTMKENNEKTPNPKELEKEIGEFLSRKFGDSVKLVSPVALTQVETSEKTGRVHHPRTSTPGRARKRVVQIGNSIEAGLCD